MSLPAMVSCIRISTLDLTGSKFTKRSCSLSIMEAAYSECWCRISSTSLSPTLLHCTNRRNTDFRRVLFLSESDISRGSRNARLFASGYWTAVLFSSLATTAFMKFLQDRRKSRELFVWHVLRHSFPSILCCEPYVHLRIIHKTVFFADVNAG